MIFNYPNPKSGNQEERVYVPRKILVRLSQYIQATGIEPNDRIFPISYVTAWSMVKKAGKLVEPYRDLCFTLWYAYRDRQQGKFASC